MDHERAERGLRLLCERALRRASGCLDVTAGEHRDHEGFIRPPPLAAPPSAETVIRDSLAGVQDVADAVSAVGAIDEELADAILAGLSQALIVRSRTISGTLARDVYRPTRGHREKAAQTGGGPADLRVAPIGRLVQVPAEGMPSDLYLMAAVVMPGMTTLTMIMHTRHSADPAADLAADPFGQPGALLDRFTAIDDQGSGYELYFTGSHGPEEWNGFLNLRPAPGTGVRWLELFADGTGALTRIDVAASPPPAEVVAEPHLIPPGERLLARVAERLLVGGGDGPPPPAIENLGEIVTLLHEVGALSRHSPLPGHLAALSECLGRGDHGIAVDAVPDVPQPWADVLGIYDGKGRPLIRPGTRPPAGTLTAVATVAVTLPEIDGVRFAVAGLHAGWNRNILYVVATGLPVPGRGVPVRSGLDMGFSWWLRDSAGRWHLAVPGRYEAGASGETRLNLSILPPLGPETGDVELLITGRSARVRARLTLRWWILPL